MTSFKRRKFTITEELDEVLTRLAEDHYQGNVSLCIRTAIEDHRASLEKSGKESAMSQRLAIKLDELAAHQEELSAAVNDLPQKEAAELSNSSHHPEGVNGAMQAVYDALADSPNPLRFEDISENIDAPIADIQTALGQLVDRGFVVTDSGQNQRYSLVGTTSENSLGP